jgi:tetratricopeptide (TPR) repeat protein
MNHYPRRLFTVVLILALAVVGGMQARRTLKKARARRLVAQAALHFKDKEFQDTSRCLQAALRADASSVDATKLTGDLLEANGSSAAIGWRIRAAQLQPANMTSRLDWALTAVKLRDWKSVEDAVSGLDEESKSTAQYHKVAAALAWNLGKPDEAQQHYQEAHRLEPDNLSNILNLGTIGLSSTNYDIAEAARASLRQLATNGPLAINVLRDLALDATRRKALSEALDYTKWLVTNSAATFGDKIDHLSLLRAMQNPDADSWLAALKQQATNSSPEASLLARWLERNDGPTNALQWLCTLPAAVRTNQPVTLVITDCQIAVKDWVGLVATVGQKEWGEAETLRLALESLAHRSLGQDEEAQTLWKRARRLSARRLDRQYQLTQLAGRWGWTSERRDVLMEIVSEFPTEKWAVAALASQLHDEGESQELEKLLSKLSFADPGNLELKTSLARLCLFRKSQLATAHRLAKEAFDTAPDDPLVLSTYAYSLFMQGQQDGALRALGDLKPQALQIPWVAACYGIIEAQSGHKDVARAPLERAQSARLLPEEMELVRLASSSL